MNNSFNLFDKINKYLLLLHMNLIKQDNQSESNLKN